MNALTCNPLRTMATKLDFSLRSDEEELMDDLELGGPTMNQTLDQLSVVNRFLGGGHAVAGLRQMWKANGKEGEFSLADLGCGGGEDLRRMAIWARKKGIKVRLWGFDANPHVVEYARLKSQDFPEIQFEVANVLDPAFYKRRFDYVSCSLFLHHFSEEQIDLMMPGLANMVHKGIIISDLQRHWLPWVLFGLVCRVCGASYMIRHDGQLSIRKAFTQRELQALAHRNHLDASISWQWAFRYRVLLTPDKQVVPE